MRKVRTNSGNVYANNTVRQNMAFANEFMAHCRRYGLAVVDPSDEFARLRKQYPRTYGKVQDAHPARWLSKQEAQSYLAACSDGTWRGSRDQLVIRLGLLGLRRSEIMLLRIRHYQDGALHFTGKKNVPAIVPVGPKVRSLLEKWLRHYARQVGRDLRPDDPLLCRCHKSGTVMWGTPIRGGQSIGAIVAYRAQLARLGHVAPHDLRRTAAGIMHRDITQDGGHRFDLRDIQKVLRHSDPAVTQRCYLDPIDTNAQDRAAVLLDLD